MTETLRAFFHPLCSHPGRRPALAVALLAGALALGHGRVAAAGEGAAPLPEGLACAVLGPVAPDTFCCGDYCGRTVSPRLSLRTKAGTVYFCCANCRKAFEKSPEKFAANANHQLVRTGQARQARCPLSGRDVDKGAGLDVAGVVVFFADAEGRARVEALPAADRVRAVFGAAGFARGFVAGPGQAGSARGQE